MNTDDFYDPAFFNSLPYFTRLGPISCLKVNAAIPDEHIFVIAVRFEGDDIIEADLDIRATHTGDEFMGVPATGRKIRFDVHGRGRFVDGKMAERWDRADFEDIRRQLTGPTQ